jgi:hypothetical protein
VPELSSSHGRPFAKMRYELTKRVSRKKTPCSLRAAIAPERSVIMSVDP